VRRGLPSTASTPSSTVSKFGCALLAVEQGTLQLGDAPKRVGFNLEGLDEHIHAPQSLQQSSLSTRHLTRELQEDALFHEVMEPLKSYVRLT